MTVPVWVLAQVVGRTLVLIEHQRRANECLSYGQITLLEESYRRQCDRFYDCRECVNGGVCKIHVCRDFMKLIQSHPWKIDGRSQQQSSVQYRNNWEWLRSCEASSKIYRSGFKI